MPAPKVAKEARMAVFVSKLGKKSWGNRVADRVPYTAKSNHSRAVPKVPLMTARREVRGSNVGASATAIGGEIEQD